ncbi:MAG: sigma-54-dependent Fis family transcriptional regulator, partial [Deltaproteobacteria bacterium]
EARLRAAESAAAWPEQASADAVEPESAFDGPSRATWEGRADVRALADLGPETNTREPAAMASPLVSGSESEDEMSSSILTCLATCDAAGLERAVAQWLAGVVEAHGAERAFVVVGEGEILASRDADGEEVGDAARKLPDVAVEQARARGGVWRATGASGRGALVGMPITVGEGAEATHAVVVLQNRFVAEAFADLPGAPPDLAPLGALLRMRTLELERGSLQTRLREAEEQRREAQTRSTEELLSLRRELESTREQMGPARSYPNIVFRSTRMKKMLRQVDRVVDTDLPVYVHGESGTGKELVARAIHDLGPRARGPFVAQNVSAIPATLFESELFGHERGAFTGANRASEGLFRRADGGTLFLDEIGDMPLDLQAKLLRVLETSEVRAVGGTRTTRVSVRVVSATHHDLRELVREGRFREDLYYRLNVIRIEIPPLRDRPDDIPVLVDHFLGLRGDATAQVRLGDGVMKALVAYAWPGNVRQLENEVTRAALLADDGVIQTRDLSPEVAKARGGGGRGDGSGALSGRLGLDRGTLKERVDRLELLVLEEALARTANNKSQVARELGLSRAGLNMKLKRLGLWSDDE